MCWLVVFLWHINLCRLFNAKPIFYVNNQFYLKQFSLAWVHSLIVKNISCLNLLIFIIKGFQTIFLIFIVISTTVWPICPLAFFRCLWTREPSRNFELHPLFNPQLYTWHNGYRRWFLKLLRRQSSGGCRFNPDCRRVTIQEYLTLVPSNG